MLHIYSRLALLRGGGVRCVCWIHILFLFFMYGVKTVFGWVERTPAPNQLPPSFCRGQARPRRDSSAESASSGGCREPSLCFRRTHARGLIEIKRTEYSLWRPGVGRQAAVAACLRTKSHRGGAARWGWGVRSGIV